MNIYTASVGMIETNCYMLCSEQGNCAVIDPGDDAGIILRQIHAHSLTPKMILFTHGHYDHIGAADELKKALGENLPTYIHQADDEMIRDAEKNLSTAILAGRGFTTTADHFLKNGDVLSLDELTIRVIATPGHTKGGVSYQVENVLFTGDTLFAGSVGRTDLYGGSFMDISASVRRLAALPGDYKVLPGHGPASTLENERRGNPYLG